MIRFQGVTKRYAAATAVDDLTLVAPTGQITVLVGPSGCGKTTTLRMVNRMIEPTGGTIWLDDQDTATLDEAQLRRGIGYVIQHAGLFPHRTVADNVATVPRLLGWDRRQARARAVELLERVGLDAAYADRYPSQLSGGQQQRVGVARALAADPPVMLMDEPFSAVDPVVREQLQDEFLRLQGELGKTILFVTHDIDEAIRLGDQVAVLRVGGRLAQVASPERLLEDPVDDFVADFVGRDRGYRALGFRATPRLALAAEPAIGLGATAQDARAASTDSWLLVVDEHGRPLGWVEPARLLGPIDRDTLHRGGTVAKADGSLRAVLDAALSAPSGRGVLVDADGVLQGTVTADQVLAAMSGPTGAASPRGTDPPGEAASRRDADPPGGSDPSTTDADPSGADS
ncbi:MAG: ATP-binding cassette domain-containing protein [Dermatophilaceae bacterium]